MTRFNLDNAVWLAFLAVMTIGLARPVSEWAKVAEGHLRILLEDRKCDVIHGTIPERPKGHGWHLRWVKITNTKRAR